MYTFFEKKIIQLEQIIMMISLNLYTFVLTSSKVYMADYHTYFQKDNINIPPQIICIHHNFIVSPFNSRIFFSHLT